VRLAGICNTDVEIMRGYHGFRGTLGHEFVGEVADVHAVSGTVKKKWLGGGSAARSTFLAARIASSPFAISAPRIENALCAADSARDRQPRRSVCRILGAAAGKFARCSENVMDEQAVFVDRSRPLAKSLDQVM